MVCEKEADTSMMSIDQSQILFGLQCSSQISACQTSLFSYWLMLKAN